MGTTVFWKEKHFAFGGCLLVTITAVVVVVVVAGVVVHDGEDHGKIEKKLNFFKEKFFRIFIL
jgi:hypothetical protein